MDIGNGSSDGLTVDERRTEMTLWSISAAPLVLGTDLTHMDATDLSLLTNDEVLAVGLFNLSGATANVTANWSDLGSSTNSFTASLPSHGSRLLKVTPAAGHGTIGAKMVSKLSGRCVDTPQGTTYNTTQLAVWDCNGAPNQNVVYTTSSRTLVLEGKCFDAYDNQTAAGTPVELYDCNGQTNQQWNKNSDGTFTGVQSGLCLDVTGESNPNGSGLELWTCNGGNNQQWTLG